MDYSYSNSGYYLLGLVIERVSGESYGTYLQRHLLAPLGLSHTGICPDGPRAPAQARGYRTTSPYTAGALVAKLRFTDVGSYPIADAFAAGGLCSNVRDLMVWSDALAHGRVVSAATYAQMTTQTRLPSGATVPYGYGLGLGDIDGHSAVDHYGGIAGFRSALVHFRDLDLNVAVLINTELTDGVDGAVENEVISAALMSKGSIQVDSDRPA